MTGRIAIVALLLSSHPSFGMSQQEIMARQEKVFGSCEAPDRSLPQDVRDYRVKRFACDHFSGEYGYDAERKEFLESMIAQNCPGLGEQKKSLDVKYKAVFSIVNAVNEETCP